MKPVDQLRKPVLRGGIGPYMFDVSIRDETEVTKVVVVNGRSYEVSKDVSDALQSKAWNVYSETNKPEMNEQVWFYDESYGVRLGIFSGNRLFTSVSGFSTLKVSHWMRAPEVP